MTPEVAQVLRLGQQAMLAAIKLTLPVLLFGLVAGLIVSVFQAVTQLQESTLTFVPKMLAVVIALVIFGGWMLATIVGFTNTVFDSLPMIPRG
jgi:flagellar biosynthetic protein FliQ